MEDLLEVLRHNLSTQIEDYYINNFLLDYEIINYPSDAFIVCFMFPYTKNEILKKIFRNSYESNEIDLKYMNELILDIG